MSDIFISYSKVDRALTVALAARLEAAGCTVWWDAELLAGEAVSQEIHRRLQEVQAVIVVWTPNSVGSDWVIAEALRGWETGKLLQVHAPGLSLREIHPPFNNRRSVPIDDQQEIAARLARLGIPIWPSEGGNVAPERSKASTARRARGGAGFFAAGALLASVVAMGVAWTGRRLPQPTWADTTDDARQSGDVAEPGGAAAPDRLAAPAPGGTPSIPAQSTAEAAASPPPNLEPTPPTPPPPSVPGKADYDLGREAIRAATGPTDMRKAGDALQRAAEQGHHAAAFLLGWLNAEGKLGQPDYAAARNWYQRAADAKYAPALVNLGLLHVHGKGGPQDYKRARALYEAAIEQGSPAAHNNLGWLYYNGWGVPNDLAAARRHFEQGSADQNPVAMRNLATIYDHGRGGAADPQAAARTLLRLAVLRTRPRSDDLMGSMAAWSAATRMAIKRQLSESGHYQGAIDGRWEDGARAAVQRHIEAAR